MLTTVRKRIIIALTSTVCLHNVFFMDKQHNSLTVAN